MGAAVSGPLSRAVARSDILILFLILSRLLGKDGEDHGSSSVSANGRRGAGRVRRRRLCGGFADRPPMRVGLIGCGWYGKSDIFRLVQVAPVEIVSLCDVDKKMMADCARDGGGAPGLQEEAADVHRLPRDAQAERPGHGGDRHAGSLARPAHDRSRQGRRATCTCKSPSAWTWWKARPCWRRPASISGWCRWAPSGAARRT